MTENGPPPHVLQAMQNPDPWGQIPQPQGPFAPQESPQAQAQGVPEPPAFFDAGDFWKVGYDFRKAGVDAHGEVPMPSQAKIDRYERTRMLLDSELGKLEREVLRPFEAMQEDYDKAEFYYRQAKGSGRHDEAHAHKAEMERLLDEANLTEEMADKALERKSQIISSYKDAVAALCSNKPTRKQLEGLPENIFMPFMSYLGRHLNPNS